MFAGLVNLAANASPLIPTPTLEPLGNDRLIRDVEWGQTFTVVPGMPANFQIAPGTVLLEAPLRLWHVSVAELRGRPDAPGTEEKAVAWLLAAATPAGFEITMVAVRTGQGRPIAVLEVPVRIGALPLPVGEEVSVQAAALVFSGRLVTLRLGTSASDDLFRSSANRLPRILDDPSVGSGDNWLIHIPAGFFTQMILERLRAALSPPPDGAIAVGAPAARWLAFPEGRWGVSATAELEKRDACPTLFGDVDISIDVTVDAVFTASTTTNAIDISLTVGGNASDWDAFRCWLGTGGIASLTTGLFVPFLQVPLAISSLVTISEVIRHSVGEAINKITVPDFTKVSQTTSSVTYAGSITVDPLPASSPLSMTLSVDAEGFAARGRALPLAPSRRPKFLPDAGPLSGTWKQEINCSLRSMDRTFTVQEILVQDDREAFGAVVLSNPVNVFLTSTAEPKGRCEIYLPPRAQPNQSVSIVCDGMNAGESGFVVLHSSAGLRTYVVGPLPEVPTSPIVGMQKLIDTFCDSFQELRPVLDIHEIKWVEPPPGYDYGHSPLRQWQIVLEDVPALAEIRVLALRDGIQQPLELGDEIVRNGDRAWITIVTDDRTDISVQVPGAGERPHLKSMQRWLLPLKAIDLHERPASLQRVGEMIQVVAGDRLVGIRVRDWTHLELDGPLVGRSLGEGPVPGGEASATPPEKTNGSGPGLNSVHALTLPNRRVAVAHGSQVVIAVPYEGVRRV
ncbi:hypothetical protein DKM19_03200 [Streptosporangium sp. 'caverna']|nr:hypothetical protein DKM19_03200 [Streptosporangium sp. 'caverna']